MANLGDLAIRVGADIEGFKRAMGDVSGTLNSTLNSAQKQFRGFDKLGSTLTSLGSRLTLGITTAVAGMGAAVVTAGGDLEALKLGLTAVTGSATEAEKQFASLRDVAKLPGLGLEEAVRGSASLQAFGFSADKAKEALLGFGNALAATGRGKADLDRVITQLGQMAGAGKVLTQDLRPIIQTVPQVAQIIKDQFGPEVIGAPAKTLDALGVSSKEFINILITELNKLPPVTGGIKNTLENFSDTVKISLAQVGIALTPLIESLVNAAVPAIEGLTKAFTSLPSGVQQGIGAFALIAAAVGPVLFVLGQLASSVTAVAGLFGSGGALATGFGAISGAVGPIVASLGGLSAVLPPIAVAAGAVAAAFALWQLQPIRDAVGQIWDTISKFLTSTLTPFATALVDTATAVGSLAQQVVSSGLAALWDAISQAASDLGGYLQELNSQGLVPLTDALGELFAALSPIGSALLSVGKALIALNIKATVLEWKGLIAVVQAVYAILKPVFSLIGTVGVAQLQLLAKAVTYLADGFNKYLVPALQYVSDKIDRFIGIASKLPFVSSVLGSSFEDSGKKATDFSSALSDMEASLTKTGGASNSFSDALSQMEAAATGASKQTADLGSSASTASAGIADLDSSAGSAAPAVENLDSAAADAGKSFDIYATALDAAKTHLADLQEAQRYGAATAEDVAKAQGDVNHIIIAMHPQWRKVTTEVWDASKAFDELQNSLGDVGDSTDATLRAVQAIPNQLPQFPEIKPPINQADQQSAATGMVSIWKSATQQVSTIFNDFGKGFANAFKAIFDNSKNNQLDKQAADLQANLDQRTADWQKYQSDIAKQMEDVTAKHKEELAKQLADLDQSVTDKKAEYAKSVQDATAHLEDIRKQNAQELAQEIGDLKSKLADKQQAYQSYAQNVQTQIEQIKRQNQEQLQSELADLKTNLRDKTQAYQDFVNQSNTTLARIGQDTQSNISDQTRNTKRNIADQQKQYDRYQEDTLKRIDELTQQDAVGNKDQIDALKESLKRKKEDLDTYIKRANEDLQTYVNEQKLREKRATEDHNAELAQRTRDYQEYVAENAQQAKDITKQHEEQVAQQTQKLEDDLAQRKADLEKFTSETNAQIKARTDYHNQQVADQTAAVQQSLKDQKDALEQFIADANKKKADLKLDTTAKIDADISGLQQKLSDAKDAYDTYKNDVATKLKDIEDEHTGPLGRIGAAFSGVFDNAYTSLLRLVGEKGIGLLMSKLTDLLNFIPGLKSALGGVFGGAASAASGAAGKIPTGVPSGTPTGGTGGGGTPSGGGAAGGGALGIFNAITGAISAGANVLQLFGVGQGGQKDRLNLIANATTYLAWAFDAGGARIALLNLQNAVLGGGSLTTPLDNISLKIDDVLYTIQNRDFSPGWLHGAWVEFLGRLETIDLNIQSLKDFATPSAAPLATADAGTLVAGSHGARRAVDRSQTIEINLNVDGRTLATSVVDYLNLAGVGV